MQHAKTQVQSVQARRFSPRAHTGRVLSVALALVGAALAASATAQGSKLDKVVIWSPGDNGSVRDWNKDPILQAVERATNTDIEMVKVGWDVYTDRINAALASGQVPDIIGTLTPENYPLIAQLARDGVLAPFEGQVAAAAPNVVGMYAKNATLNAVKVDGKIYGQPVYWETGNGVSGRVIHIRKDLLDKLKLPVPTTFSAYYKFLQACSKANGISGVTFNGTEDFLDNLVAFTGAQGLPLYGWVKTPRGYESPYIQPAMKNALLLFRQMVATGTVDPGVWEANQDTTRAKYVSGGACSFIFNGGGHVGRIQNDFDLTKKGAQNYVLAAPSGGKSARGYGTAPAFYGITVVTKLRGNNPVAAARVLNYLASPAGLKLTALGVAGRDYTETGGTVKLNAAARARSGFPAQAGDTGAHPLATTIVSWVPQNWQDFQLLYGKPASFKRWYDQMWVNQRRYLVPSVGPLTTSPAWNKFKPTGDDLARQAFVRIVRAPSDAQASALFDQFVRAWKTAGGEAASAQVSQLLSAAR